MLNKLYLHPHSRQMLEKLISDMPHCILLSGKKGTGLQTISLALARELGSTPILVIPDEKDSIKIDRIRNLYRQTSTKNKHMQVIIIDNADSMAIPAQNAMLKLLEEPNEKIAFILTSHLPQSLLSTIRSRAQEIAILPLATKESNLMIDSTLGLDSTISKQIQYMANGLPAEIIRLKNDPIYFAQRADSIRSAREFMQASSYQRLITIQQIGQDRNRALQLIQDAMRIITLSLAKNAQSELIVLLENYLDTEQKLQNDGNIRTQMLNLAF